MRILWLSNVGSRYNGVGWMQSLLDLLKDSANDIALAFLSDGGGKTTEGGVSYYTIKRRSNTLWQKILEHYGGYRRCSGEAYLNDIREVIEDFKPDIIHVFGFEIALCEIIGNTDIPVVVHIQGLLTPIDNAFFPNGFNKRTFAIPPTIDELVLNRGFIYDKDKTYAMALREIDLLKKTSFVMGRTGWDRRIMQLLAPQARYFHVDEVLRPSFYKNAGQWEPHNGTFTIVSTLSQVLYKGLDLALKTALILKRHTEIDFRWEIVGIERGSYITKVLEKKTGIDSDKVNIIYKGVKDEEGLCETLLLSDAYVHTSYIDNSPNSVCEAQMLGVPTIATNVGGTATLIHDNETGLLVPANDPYQLASLIIMLQSDEETCVRLSHNATQAALTRHDKTKIVNEILNTYSSIIKDKQ